MNLLNQLTTVTVLRDCVGRLREGNLADVINDMELMIDATVISLNAEISESDDSTKNLVLNEFGSIRRQRQAGHDFDNKYLDSMPSEQRKKALERRAQAERILKAARPTDNAH